MLVETRDAKGSEAVAQLLSQFGLREQIHILSLLADHDRSSLVMAAQAYKGSVLDSGAAKHLNPRTHVTDPDDCCSLTGFNNTTEWTQGNGYLPLRLYDTSSDALVSADIGDVDKLDNLAQPVLSMGKLIRKKWKFVFDGPDQLWAYAPGGAHKYLVELGDDDIIRLPHDIRTGVQSCPLPVIPAAQPSVGSQAGVLSVTSRVLQTTNGVTFHEILNHCSTEKVYQTLLHTKGRAIL